jgi:phospholipid/cholesterol/gamma-HCH transport system substrate-binding protein
MLTGRTRLQLGAFAVVSVLTVGVILVSYLGLPAQLGQGVRRVSLHLPDAAGLHQSAKVTYRGVEVGKVQDVEVARDGVTAELAIDDEYAVPGNVVAQIHDMSPVGEQYVDLYPGPSRAGGRLEDGDVIPADRVTLQVTTAQMLDEVHGLLRSVPRRSLRTTVDELYLATRGTGDDMGRLFDSAREWQDAADAGFDDTAALVESLAPVLGTQQASAGDIRSYSRDLRTFSEQLVLSDRDIRGAIAQGRPLARQVDGTVRDLDPTLPVLMADLASVGGVLEVYRPNIEHMLIVLPALENAMLNLLAPAVKGDPYDWLKLDFKTPLNSSPACTQGFEYARRQRDPNDLSPAPIPQQSYCKVSPSDPRVVRGVRNDPCPQDPSRRGPTARACGLVFPRYTVEDPPTAVETAGYDPGTGRVVTADGQLFRVADLAQGAREPTTWQELLRLPLREAVP